MADDGPNNPYLLQRMLILNPQGGTPLKIKCKFHYYPHSRTINLATTLHRLFHFHPSVQSLLQDNQLFYVDQRHQTKNFLGYSPLEDCQVEYDDWGAQSIMIAYRKGQVSSKAHPKVQIKKSRQRTIRQVMRQIERWRQVLAEQNNTTNFKPITLIGAARSIGVSKKSLDDYLRIIKTAQRLNFDFQRFQGRKIGFLRSFIRSRLKSPAQQKRVMSEIDSYWDSTYLSKQG